MSKNSEQINFDSDKFSLGSSVIIVFLNSDLKQFYKYAIKRYSRRKDKNLPQLMRYTESFRVTKLLRSYMEVLL